MKKRKKLTRNEKKKLSKAGKLENSHGKSKYRLKKKRYAGKINPNSPIKYTNGENENG